MPNLNETQTIDHDIDLEKLEETFMMEVGALVDGFLLEVNTKLADPVEREFGVRYVEHMTSVDGVMCLITCKLKGALTAAEMVKLFRKLDEAYCMSEGDPADGPEISGYKWYLGDGDDVSAVQFDDGQIKIWLRGWK